MQINVYATLWKPRFTYVFSGKVYTREFMPNGRGGAKLTLIPPKKR